MKTTLRIISRENRSRYKDIPNPFNMIPCEGDSLVWEGNSYGVNSIEYDYDDNTVYIIVH